MIIFLFCGGYSHLNLNFHPVATAIVATVATLKGDEQRTVAEIAEIAVADEEKMKKTKILGFEKDVPIIEVYQLKDSFRNNFFFWCDQCLITHVHSNEEGHRNAHCHNTDSKFRKTGYILKLKQRNE